MHPPATQHRNMPLKAAQHEYLLPKTTQGKPKTQPLVAQERQHERNLLHPTNQMTTHTPQKLQYLQLTKQLHTSNAPLRY